MGVLEYLREETIIFFKNLCKDLQFIKKWHVIHTSSSKSGDVL